MREIKKHCNTCNYSFMEKEPNSASENGFVEMQHCSNRIYNSPAYTHEMIMKDWDKGYCRLWTPRERMNEHEKQLLHLSEKSAR